MLERPLRDYQLNTLLLTDNLTQGMLCLLLARALSNWMDKVWLTTRQGPACRAVTSNAWQPYACGPAHRCLARRSLWRSLGGSLRGGLTRSLARNITPGHIILIITLISMDMIVNCLYSRSNHFTTYWQSSYWSWGRTEDRTVEWSWGRKEDETVVGEKKEKCTGLKDIYVFQTNNRLVTIVTYFIVLIVKE